MTRIDEILAEELREAEERKQESKVIFEALSSGDPQKLSEAMDKVSAGVALRMLNTATRFQEMKTMPLSDRKQYVEKSLYR